MRFLLQTSLNRHLFGIQSHSRQTIGSRDRSVPSGIDRRSYAYQTDWRETAYFAQENRYYAATETETKLCLNEEIAS